MDGDDEYLTEQEALDLAEDQRWSEQEGKEVGEWLSTWPGMVQRLANRRNALTRLEALGAPEIILENQRRLVREIEEQLA